MRRLLVIAGGSCAIFGSAVVALHYSGRITTERMAALEVFLVTVHAGTVLVDWVSSLFNFTDGSAVRQQSPSATTALQRTRQRPLKRFLIVLTNVAVAVASSLLLATPFLAQPRVQWLAALTVSDPAHAHLLAIGLALYVVGLTVWYGSKNHAKHRKLLRIEKASAVIARLGLPSSKPSRKELDDRSTAVDDLLRHLLIATDNKLLPFIRELGRSYGLVRTAWVLIPLPAEGQFRVVHLISSDGTHEFADVVKGHRPKRWDRVTFEKIEAEWQTERAKLKRTFRRRLDEQTKSRLRACGSLTGFIFEQEGPRAYRDVEHCEVFDEGYLKFIPEGDKEQSTLRSAAGISIRVAGEPVAVLELFSNATYAFLEPDSTALRVWAHLLAPVIATNAALGVYDEDRLREVANDSK